ANGAGELLGGGIRLSRAGEPIRHHLGISGFATYAVVDRRSVVPVGADVPPAVAALLGCAVLTGGGAILNAGGIQPGQDLIIVGLGGIGMAALLVARAVGARTVIGVDPSPQKAILATSLGADEAMSPDEAIAGGFRAPVVLDATGVGRGFETAFDLTQVGGTTVTAGLPAATDVASISPLRLTAEARTVVGSYLGSSIPSRDIPRYEAMWRSGDLPLERLITRTLELEQINLAMDLLSDATELRQVISMPSG
ncbi:MAG: zinc-binding dehydrogenase, partial [bacterium]|nr:zinc-binding dehydrogenase [bacterium]